MVILVYFPGNQTSFVNDTIDSSVLLGSHCDNRRIHMSFWRFGPSWATWVLRALVFLALLLFLLAVTNFSFPGTCLWKKKDNSHGSKFWDEIWTCQIWACCGPVLPSSGSFKSLVIPGWAGFTSIFAFFLFFFNCTGCGSVWVYIP